MNARERVLAALNRNPARNHNHITCDLIPAPGSPEHEVHAEVQIVNGRTRGGMVCLGA